MEQTKALNSLEPFLALTKSASSSRAAADLISRATSHPNTFVFAELLNTSNIRALESAPEEQAAYLKHLEIFSYGTYSEYQSIPSLPALNPAQTLKLRQLSFLSLAKDPKNLTYAALKEKLGLESEKELEEVVISAVYAGLVQGSLDPYHEVVHLSSISPLRDLPPSSTTAMLNTLAAWSARCSSTLTDLEMQIQHIKAESAKRQKAEEDWEKIVEGLVEDKKSGGKGKEEGEGKGFFGGVGKMVGNVVGKRDVERISDDGDEDGMDVDEENDTEEGERRGSKAAKKKNGFFGHGK